MLQGLLRSPLFVRFICAQMWGRGVLPAALPAPFSATLSLALGLSVCKCGAAGSAPALFVPHSASLHPATAT